MTTYFRNARLATMEVSVEPYGLLDAHALGLDAGRIAWIGPETELPGTDPADDVVDCGGKLLTPGLIDCHTHLVYAGNRSAEFDERLSGRRYTELTGSGRGILATVNATRAADDETLFSESARRLKSLMADGVTSVEIKSGYGLDLATERRMLATARALADACAINVHTTFLGAHAVPDEYRDRADDYIDTVANEMLPRLAADGLVDSVDAFCEHVGFSREQTERVFRAARALELPVRLHAEQLSYQGGAALAADYGALSVDHLEYLPPDEAAVLARSGTVAVLLPGAFYYLRETQRPPLDALRQHGVGIAVATDCNPGSSPIASLSTVMNMGCVLFGLTPEEALAGVTRHAAAALGVQDRKGTLSVGKDADLALWDVGDPAELSYRLGERRCDAVWVGGVRRSP